MGVARIARVAMSAALVACLLFTACTRQIDVLQAAVRAQTLFDFHSNMWMNLHHVLYEEAQRRHPRDDGQRAPSLLGPTRLTPDELASWEAAVAYYDSEFITADRDLVFDEGLNQIARVLIAEKGDAQLTAAQLPPALREILQHAAVVYTKHWWPAHDAQNRKLVSSLMEPLQKYGAGLQQELLKTYQASWPGGAQQRVHVEVVYYAERREAYTLLRPTQITFGSIEDERSAGWRKLELLLHESSHALLDKYRADIEATSQRLGREPGALWHALLFFTTGEVVRRTLEKDGVADYVPYAYHIGLFAADGSWSSYARALEKHWQPYLSGSKDYESALTGLVDAMPAASPQ